MLESPFWPDNRDAFARWRDEKIESYPTKAENLIVEVRSLTNPTESESNKILALCEKTGLAFYFSNASGVDAAKDLGSFGERFGLNRLDANFFAEDQGFTAIQISSHQGRGDYIPYTNQEIKWHTDGYYNPPERTIRGLLLHCERPAKSGGANQVLDPEMLYLQLREESEDMIRALMQPDVMEIPAHVVDGVVHREVSTGPVFRVDDDGRLLMRYTARKRNIQWKDEPTVRAAVLRMTELMSDTSPFVFEIGMQAGQGLISNNVLHNREGFEDDPESPRLYYRLRYYDRIRTEASKQFA